MCETRDYALLLTSNIFKYITRTSFSLRIRVASAKVLWEKRVYIYTSNYYLREKLVKSARIYPTFLRYAFVRRVSKPVTVLKFRYARARCPSRTMIVIV